MNGINVPIEQVYLFANSDESSLVRRDPKRLNRYWFKYPEEWRTSTQKERIIGVRSFWISRQYRRLKFTVSVKKELVSDPTKVNELTFDVYSWLDYDEDLESVWIDFRNHFQKNIEEHKQEWPADVPELKGNEIWIDLIFDIVNNEKAYCLKMFCPTNEIEVGGPQYKSSFLIRNFNDDAKAVFNVPDNYTPEYNTELMFNNVWDRHSIFLTSSLCTSTVRNYLGFSNVRYEPIKYFKISNIGSVFWLDMFQSHQHDTPLVLPLDNKEALVLELVILQEAHELYS